MTNERQLFERSLTNVGGGLVPDLDTWNIFKWSAVCKSNMAQYVGTVIGTKMDKTVKVLVTRMALYTKLKTVRHNFHLEDLIKLFLKYFSY